MSTADIATTVAFVMVPVGMAIGGLVMLIAGRRGQRGGGQSGGARHTRRTLRMRRANNRTRRA
jgi:hypothetical protein